MKFDDFDKMLKEKAHEDDCKLPDSFDRRINEAITSLPYRKKHRSTSIKIAVAAALAAVISVTSVLATNIPAVKNMVSAVVSYFDNTKDTRYFTDKSSFDKFNKAVGVSAENKDIKLTIDNIAIDDNFMNIFYTIENKNPIDMKFNDENKLFEAELSTPFLNYKINGKSVEPGNHNDTDAYFQGDKILKAMARVNVSQINLPKNFDLEISTDEIFKTKGKWGITTTIDKSAVAVETKTAKPNITAKFSVGDIKHSVTIDKVSISPFGSQVVLSERVKNNRLFDKFALIDDKGNVLDVLNTDERINSFPLKTTNSFEFVKADMSTKYITLIPIKFAESGKAVEIKEDIKKLPITFKTCNTGSRVVDKIEFDKNRIKINYHNEGVELWDPAFMFYDANGNKLDLGDCGLSTSVDRQNGKYTAILTFNKNANFSKIAQIGTFAGVDHLELLKDQQVRIDLDK